MILLQVPLISMNLLGPLEVGYFDPSYPLTFGHYIGPLLATANVQSSRCQQPVIIGLPGADALNAQTNELTEVEKPDQKDVFFRIVTVTPLKINMEHNHGGLEDHFPFLNG